MCGSGVFGASRLGGTCCCACGTSFVAMAPLSPGAPDRIAALFARAGRCGLCAGTVHHDTESVRARMGSGIRLPAFGWGGRRLQEDRRGPRWPGRGELKGGVHVGGRAFGRWCSVPAESGVRESISWTCGAARARRSLVSPADEFWPGQREQHAHDQQVRTRVELPVFDVHPAHGRFMVLREPVEY